MLNITLNILKVISRVILLTLVFLLILLWQNVIVYSASDSIARGFYLVLPKCVQIREGDLMRFENPLYKNDIYYRGIKITKDTIKEKYFIKRVDKIIDKHNTKVLYYVLGKTDEELKGDGVSFDSRFYGYVEKGRKAILLWKLK